ncbi:hypothetical protein KI387_011865, partial [Taxus chinensis]
MPQMCLGMGRGGEQGRLQRAEPQAEGALGEIEVAETSSSRCIELGRAAARRDSR